VGIEVLAAASLAASIGGGIAGAFGAAKKADAETASYEYKAQVARNNAIIAERNAAAATEAGGVAGQVNDLKTKNLIGTQLVTQAASGLDVNQGSAVEVRQSAADLGHLDTMTIINNAAKQAAGFRAQGANFTAEAALDTSAADYAQDAKGINIATSLLGGAGSLLISGLATATKG
jgi:hypothetical protein